MPALKIVFARTSKHCTFELSPSTVYIAGLWREQMAYILSGVCEKYQPSTTAATTAQMALSTPEKGNRLQGLLFGGASAGALPRADLLDEACPRESWDMRMGDEEVRS